MRPTPPPGASRSEPLLTAVCAAIVAFAILPQISSFAGFCAALGLVLVPAGALSAQPWQPALFTALEANFVPLLAPSNPMTYDPGDVLQHGNRAARRYRLRHAGLSAAAAHAARDAGATAARAQPAGSAPPQPGRGRAASQLGMARYTAGCPRSRVRSIACRRHASPRPCLSAARSCVCRRIARRFGLDADLEGAMAGIARGGQREQPSRTRPLRPGASGVPARKARIESALARARHDPVRRRCAHPACDIFRCSDAGMRYC